MANKRKFKKGDVVSSLDELVDSEFVYWRDKVTHRGWFLSWQLKMTQDAIKSGVIRKAIKIQEADNG